MAKGVTETTGIVCKCGATDPGKGPNCKWRKGPNGEWLCHSCGIQAFKKNACPVCGRVYKKNEYSFDNNAWIRCDDCHRWVMTSCDSIVDLSMYDDSNPNHLHYSCPICRSEDVYKKAKTKKPEETNKDGNAPKINRLDLMTTKLQKQIIIDYATLTREPTMTNEMKEKLKLRATELNTQLLQMAVTLKEKQQQEVALNQKVYQEKMQRLHDEWLSTELELESELVGELKDFYAKQKRELDIQFQKMKQI